MAASDHLNPQQFGSFTPSPARASFQANTARDGAKPQRSLYEHHAAVGARVSKATGRDGAAPDEGFKGSGPAGPTRMA